MSEWESEWGVVPSAELRDTASAIREWVWPLDESAVLERVEQLGWQLVGSEHRLAWSTGWVGSRPRASASRVAGVVSSLRVTTSEVLLEESVQSTAFIRDVFVGQVKTLTTVLGEPVERDSGSMASVRWLLPSGAGFTVGEVGTGCYWQVRSPEFMELDRINERLEQRSPARHKRVSSGAAALTDFRGCR